jgi:hypothetical protein
LRTFFPGAYIVSVARAHLLASDDLAYHGTHDVSAHGVARIVHSDVHAHNGAHDVAV